LGIGATAAIWSAVHAVLLAGLPYPHADRLVLVEGALHEGNNPVEKVPVSYRDFYDWDQRSHAFGGLQAYSDPLSFNLVTGDRPEHVLGEMVSGGYFAMLGARPLPGRAIGAADDSPGAPAVVVVSQGLSQRYAPRASSLLGATLRLNGRPYVVVGLMPAGFRGLTDRAELWLPLAAAPAILGDR